MCLRFLKSYFKLEPSWVFLNRSAVLKNSFSDEKTAVKSETHCSRKAIKV